MKAMMECILQGWKANDFDDDGYARFPLRYIERITGLKYKDVEKVPIKDLNEFPEGEYIVEWENPKGGSHFTIENKITISTDTALFDPAGASISRKYNKTISYRKFIVQ